MNKGKNSPDQQAKIISAMSLEEFELKLATDPDNNNFKMGLTDSVASLQKEILPLRLKFNEFLNLMATLDQEDGNNNSNKLTSQERFNMVKTNLVSLYNDIQRLSKDFQSLEGLFGCISEYTGINNTKEFEPLESLSINYTSTGSNTPNQAGGTPTSTAHTKKNTASSQTNNKTSPQVGTLSSSNAAAAVSSSANNNNNNNNNNKNNSALPGNTPVATPTTTGTAPKKPRKPRQPRKQSAATATSVSQASTPASGNISINTSMNTASKMQSPAMIQTPLMTSSGNTPLATMNMGQGTMNPSTILGMTPNGSMGNNNNNNNNNMNNKPNPNNNVINGAVGITTGNSSTILSPANVLNNAILNTGGNGNGNVPNAGISNNGMNMNNTSGNMGGPVTGAPNSLTPANILSMSNMDMNNILPASDSRNMMNGMDSGNTASGTNNNNDLSGMDLTTLDLSSLNMDFL